MGIWTDLPNCTWQGPTPNHSGHMLEQRGVVVHIAEGGYDGTISWCKNPNSNVSCHFVVAKDGRIAQLADTDVTVWTQIAGNGHWLSVENEGFTPNPLTAAQVEANAQILAKAHQVYGVPLQVAFDPNGRGLGHHSMGTNGHQNPTDTWTGPTWGHEDCPGPAIYNQKPAIVARAEQIVGGVMAIELDTMIPQPADHYPELGGLNEVLFGVGTGYAFARLVRLEEQVGEILALLKAGGTGGGGVSGPVDLTDAAVGKVATAVVNEEHNRLAQ